MSEFSENKELETAEAEPQENAQPAVNDNDDAFSTIFSAPAEHNDKAVNSNKKRLITIIASFLAVAVLVGGTISIIKLIPEMEDEETSSSVFEDITVLDLNSDKFDTLTVKNSQGEFKLYTEQLTTNADSSDESSQEADENSEETSSAETKTSTAWRVEGVETSKLSNTTVTSIVSAAASVTAKREITTKSASDCGFDEPQFEITISSTQVGNYTILVGAASPDGTGTYLKLADKDNIYIVDDSAVSVFEFNLLDLADKTSLSAVSFSADTTGKVDENGRILYFDSLTFEGKNFPETVTVINNTDESDSGSLMPYIITTPIERYAEAEALSAPLDMFSSEISVMGIYSYDITEQSMAAVGLDNPDIFVTLTVEGESKWFKVSKVDDSYCAVIRDDSQMIYKVTLANFPVLEYKTEDLYSTWVTLYSINDLSGMDITVEGEKYNFDIASEEDEDGKTTYTIHCNDELITTEYFQSFYQNFLDLDCSDYTVSEISAAADCTVKFTFNDGSKSELEFRKSSETSYQYRLDGMDMGKVTSSAYNKVIKNLKLVAENKEP